MRIIGVVAAVVVSIAAAAMLHRRSQGWRASAAAIGAARAQLDHNVRSLVGQRLVRVAYYEILMEEHDIARWDFQADVDTLDFGLELRFESGDRCWITWGTAFETYALQIEINTAEDRSLMRERDASEVTRWKGMMGLEIADARVFWAWDGVTFPRRWSPQDLELTFHGGDVVFISSLEISVESGLPFLAHMDTITVIFDRDVANRYSVGQTSGKRMSAPAARSSGGLTG